jgi:hypothetical protein
MMGHCYCMDCRKASGAGFIPFIGFHRSQVQLTGPAQAHTLPVGPGREATRNFCPDCGGLVFGGKPDSDDSINLYAGSLDEPSLFRPTIAIFARNRPSWAPIPDGLKVFDALPSAGDPER